MSAIDVLAPGRSDVLPGVILLPPLFPDHGEIEDVMARASVAVMIGGATDANPDNWSKAMDWAATYIASRPFAYGSAKLAQALASRWGVGVGLWYCVRQNQPTTLAQARGMVTEANYADVALAVLDLWRYKKKAQAVKTPASSAPSNITTSSEPSATAATAGQTSAA